MVPQPQKKEKQKACPFRVDWLGGYFFRNCGSIHYKVPFQGNANQIFFILRSCSFTKTRARYHPLRHAPYRAAGRWMRAGPERAPVAASSTWSSRSTFRWLKELRPYTRAERESLHDYYLQARAAWPSGCGANRPLTQSPKRVLRARGWRSRCSTCHLGYSKAGKLPNCDEAPWKLNTARP